ncbi:L-xylulose reductase-like protein [Leptotrombidium deliense]|uniref:L-xylulose reductase-like protein n=1 Tax=Leptotrombidium deliense TaxID=299467 RepID=A0A443SIN0_9ACAR|nr:L-xylulose reductase-like protein [Leptotrombidium deliense]
MEFDGKVVIVTGSTSGNGEHTAIKFAENGAKVVITGRNEQRMQNVVKRCDEVSPKGYKAFGVIADITKEEDCERLINSTVEHYGKLDILVNNAGCAPFGPLEDPKLLSYLDETINVNIRPTVRLSLLAIPHLVATKGNIVNMSSFGAKKPAASMLPLCTTDAAREMITRVMALELGQKGVRVNCVRPGFIKTPVYEAYGFSFEELMKSVKQPLQKLGSPLDVAHCILFLASEKSSFITGSCLTTDGGILNV